MKKRYVGLSVILLAAFAGLCPAQEKPRPVRANPALLVMDIQNAYLPRMSEQDKKMGMEMINHLINLFRAHQSPIIRVYHTDPKYGPKPGSEEFEYPKTVAIKDEWRICNTWLITAKSFPRGRIKVVLVNEDLGL